MKLFLLNLCAVIFRKQRAVHTFHSTIHGPFLRAGTILTVTGLIAAFLASGCDRKTTASPYPAPGEMRLISVKTIARRVQLPNLLPEGGFSKWLPGAPASEGFLPPDGAFSTLSSRQIPDRQSTAAVQQWSQIETPGTPATCFRALLSNLGKETEYELTATAENQGGVIASIGVWEVRPNGYAPLDRGVVHLLPAAHLVKNYKGTFTSRQDSSILIASSANHLDADGGSVSWYEWRLHPTGAAR